MARRGAARAVSARAGPLLALRGAPGAAPLARLRGRGGVAELVAQIVLFAVAIPAGLVFAAARRRSRAFHAARAGHGLRPTVGGDGALLRRVADVDRGGALALRARGARPPALPRLPNPVRPRSSRYGLVASVVGDPFAVFWCLLLAGAFVGAALARPGAWVLLPRASRTCVFVRRHRGARRAPAGAARAARARPARPRARDRARVYVGTRARRVGAGRRAARASRCCGCSRTLRWVAYPAALADGRGAPAVRRARSPPRCPGSPRSLARRGRRGLGRVPPRARGARSRAAERALARRGDGRGRAGGSRAGSARCSRRRAKYLLRHPLSAVLALVLPALAGVVGGGSRRAPGGGGRGRRGAAAVRLRALRAPRAAVVLAQRLRLGARRRPRSGSSRRSRRRTCSSRRTAPRTSFSLVLFAGERRRRGSRSAARRRRGRSSARSRSTPASRRGSSRRGTSCQS